MQYKLKIAFFILLLPLAISVNGQKLINSPYARFNLGSLTATGSFRSLAMGGMGTSLRENRSVFFSNPASYSSMDTISFVFDFGIDYAYSILSDQSSKYHSDDMSFDHLLMAAPIRKGWGLAFGVTPYSDGYYKIAQNMLKTDPGYDPMIGEYQKTHSGEGGFNNFFVGTGINVTKNLSLGINMKVMLGEIKRTAQFDFADFYSVYNDKGTESLHISGINFDYGLQYIVPLKNDYFLSVGASLNSKKNYRTKFEHFTYAYTAYGANDTISYILDDSTRTFIPGTVRVGISFGKKNKFLAGFDYVATKWSNAHIPGSEGYAADTKGYLFGLEFIPDKFSNYSLFKRLEYRLGGRIQDNYLLIHNEQIKEYGASFGIGFPIRKSNSKANLFFDYTRKTGSAEKGLYEEDNFRVGVSLNLYDNWFMKRKYD